MLVFAEVLGAFFLAVVFATGALFYTAAVLFFFAAGFAVFFAAFLLVFLLVAIVSLSSKYLCLMIQLDKFYRSWFL